jgi:hypothetical protein
MVAEVNLMLRANAYSRAQILLLILIDAHSQP